MPLFDQSLTESQTTILIQRMIALREEVAAGNISVEELAIIANLSTADLAGKSEALADGTLEPGDPTNQALIKLYQILKSKKTSVITDNKAVVEGLVSFGAEHSDYLPLTPLAVENTQTLTLGLNDFASFYDVFIKHMDFKKSTGEMGNEYSVTFDPLAAKTSWLQWKNTRLPRLKTPSEQAGYPGLFEKFIDGKLKKDEWLTDQDIHRELAILDLKKVGTHVVPFKADDIGLALHFEREKHQYDNPKKPYVIPLIVNLGEDGHSRIDSRGNHWTRMLVTVDPTEAPTKITVDYTDELLMHDASKKNIERTIREALKYETKLGGYTSGDQLKIYTAFPGIEPDIVINDTKEQRDGYTCGYRALRGLVKDLVEKGVIEKKANINYEKFINCQNGNALRDFVYRSLLGEQAISADMQTALEKEWGEGTFAKDDARRVIMPSLIEGQLFAFSSLNAKASKGKKFDSQQLQELAAQNDIANQLRELPSIKQLATSTDESAIVNIQELLNSPNIKAINNDSLALQIIFEALGQNNSLNKIELNGTEGLDPTLLHQEIDKLPFRFELTSPDLSLQSYLEVIRGRNAILMDLKIYDQGNNDPWDLMLEKWLFTPPLSPTNVRFEWTNHYTHQAKTGSLDMGATGLKKFLQYTAENKGQFSSDFPYQVLSIAGANSSEPILELLSTLKTHLQSPSPFVPFKEFAFHINDLNTVDKKELVENLLQILEAAKKNMPAPGLERIEITTSAAGNLDEKTVEALIDAVKENGYPTVISFNSNQDDYSLSLTRKLKELENLGLANRRATYINKLDQPLASSAPQEKITLGRIGKAILQTESLGPLETEVQVQQQQQQQQQQQVQQQVQTAIDDESLQEEDELEVEQFPTYSGKEVLIDRLNMAKLTSHISYRHSQLELDPEQCWDLITGVNAEAFKYGIKKMTITAATKLIDNLEHVQYGLHPDNLPKGFALEQDEHGDVILTYNQFNGVVNPNESPLTIQFNKPMQENYWVGSALQFLSTDEAEKLYKTVFGNTKNPKYTLDECINKLFFFKDPSLTLAQQKMILNGFIDGTAKEDSARIKESIANLFGDKLSSKNVLALAEVLYQKGPQALSELLDSFEEIKKVKGDKFFQSFKTCFIDTSVNLTELTGESARASMQKLLALSPAQSEWWTKLTEQHTSNLKYRLPEENSAKDWAIIEASSAGQRWANLSELTEGFLYFCGQLEEIHPGLKLTEHCPLTNVADMRVGLDRLLLTILPNALDINEQFYSSLNNLSLDPLGPFYASRYEGFKLVMPEMMLALGTFHKKIAEDKKYAEKGFCFKCGKGNLGANITAYSATDTPEKKIAVLLRYIATFNHRRPQKEYMEAFNQVLSNEALKKCDEKITDILLIIISAFGTGKRGKHFTQGEVDTLIKWASTSQPGTPDYKSRVSILNQWQAVRNYPARPTFSEIVAISEMALKSKAPGDTMKSVIWSLEHWKHKVNEAGSYFEILSLMTKNKNGIGIDLFHTAFMELEGLNGPIVDGEHVPLRHIKDAKAEFGDSLDSSTRIATARLLALVNRTGIDENNVVAKTRDLYTAIKACQDKHGPQTTRDLLELLGNIEVNSKVLPGIDPLPPKVLPSLDQLTAIVKNVSDNAKPNYSALEQRVKSELPEGCTIEMDKVVAAPVEAEGNLHMILAANMGKIITKLEGFGSLINQLGEGFLDRLKTPEGPAVLLGGLEKISELPYLARKLVQREIIPVMNDVYDTVIKDGIKSINAPATSARLTKIINKLNRQAKTEEDLQAFAKLYGKELDSTSQILGNLKRIQQHWPNQFNSVVNALDSCESLNAYPISLLAQIMEALTRNFDENQPFPIATLEQFLSFNNLNEATQLALSGIIDTIFDPDQPTLLNDQEKRLMCELAIKYCQTNSNGAQKFTETLITLKESDPEYFDKKLNLLLAIKDFDKDLTDIQTAMDQVSALNNPALNAEIFSFFTGERASEFVPFMKKIGEIEESKKPLFISIALRAAQQELKAEKPDYKPETLLDVITALNNMDATGLKKIEALYNTPIHPELSILNTFLQKGEVIEEEVVKDGVVIKDKLVIKDLEAHYDRDPWNRRSNPENLASQFDTSQVATYLDNLRDMNYDRPMLLSQRQELQKWFLYVNCIGKDRPIPTIKGELKVIKDMSHSEIQGLLQHYRKVLADPKTSPEQKTKAKLESIAILREAMYRGTGKFPRPTQILYLLSAMQGGKDYVAQIQTGQGKSLTAALAAAMANLEGKTVDVCTSNLFLAAEGLNENRRFFDYIGTPAKLIHAGSGMNVYQPGAIHYSSMSDLALYRSKTQLLGKEFPKDCVLIADEIDFSTLDDNTRYRYATTLDPVTDPYQSPYTWIYEALIPFVDNQTSPQTDEEFIKKAETWLKNTPKTKEQQAQLKRLEEQPEIYKKRLETWLIAAGKTRQLAEQEQTKFRVVTLDHPKGTVSKACILTGGRPNISAEFSNVFQQFLHLRMREKYKAEIKKGTMPDFLVEPEKTYVTSLNSKILMNTYERRMGMSGTVGSSAEIKEQYAKYGFRFIDIPPFTPSKRVDLPPILTNPKLVHKPEDEEKDHIQRIVNDTLRHILREKNGKCSPMLIHCADKVEGEKIYLALQTAIGANPKKYQRKFSGMKVGIQRFYSSERSTEELRNEEEKEFKHKAGQDGVITISTVFDRGTDIEPGAKGLYTVATYVDTSPYSAEDLERSKRQKIGRAGRADQVGYTRLIVRRSEFKDVYNDKQIKNIPETNEGLDRAIADLNKERNQKRTVDRELRESFDDVKEIIYQEFSKFIKVINDSDEKIPKKAIRDQLLTQWNSLLGRIDNKWEDLQHNPAVKSAGETKLKQIAAFACQEWNVACQKEGPLTNALESWANHNKITISLPPENRVDDETMVANILTRHPLTPPYYVKSIQRNAKVDPSVSADAVYSDLMSSVQNPSDELKAGITAAKTDAIHRYIERRAQWLSSSAHAYKLKGKFNFTTPQMTDAQKAEQVMGAMLYFRYKASRDGNSLGVTVLSRECQNFARKMMWSKDPALIQAAVKAEESHFSKLTDHRGDYEDKKGIYLDVIMAEARSIMPEQTSKWKNDAYDTWWANAKVPIIDALTSYRDKWWTRGWVASDRKEVVTNLIGSLNSPDKTPGAILGDISAARKALLEDDYNQGRSINNGLNGRLNRYLNELEQKVHAALPPQALDDNIDIVFKDIETVLESFQKRLKHPDLEDVLKTLKSSTASFNDKHTAISGLFKNISLMDVNGKRFQQENWRALHNYCSDKQHQLVYYFAQCDKLSSVNEQRSVTVFKAVSEAAASLFHHVRDKISPSQMKTPEQTFEYNGKAIIFEGNSELGIRDNDPFFQRINHEGAYKRLLDNLEKSIVEYSPDGTRVQFTKIYLDKTDRYVEGTGFKLVVEMKIDGVSTQVDYHINMKTGTAYCDNKSLMDLDKALPKDPDLAESTLNEEFKELQNDWNELKLLGIALTDEIQTTLASFEKELAGELVKRYTHEVTSATQEKRPIKDFKVIAEQLREEHKAQNSVTTHLK